jgi:prepilin-type N-terminal cleavage/methylation domain-containing protein
MSVHKKGFSLIELMIALVITVTLITTIIPWSIQCIAYYTGAYTRINARMELCFAHNLLLKDIMDGSRNAACWDLHDPMCLIGKAVDGSWFCWMVRDGNLVRIIASSESLLQKPKKRRAIPVLRGVSNVTVHADSSNGRMGLFTIECTYAHEQYQFKGAARNAYT